MCVYIYSFPGITVRVCLSGLFFSSTELPVSMLAHVQGGVYAPAELPLRPHHRPALHDRRRGQLLHMYVSYKATCMYPTRRIVRRRVKRTAPTPWPSAQDPRELHSLAWHCKQTCFSRLPDPITCTLPLNLCLTAYAELEGVQQTSLSKIGGRYLRTWFLTDFLSSIPTDLARYSNIQVTYSYLEI